MKSMKYIRYSDDTESTSILFLYYLFIYDIWY